MWFVIPAALLLAGASESPSAKPREPGRAASQYSSVELSRVAANYGGARGHTCGVAWQSSCGGGGGNW